MYCRFCGEQLNDAAQYCTQCGAPIEKTDVQSEQHKCDELDRLFLPKLTARDYLKHHCSGKIKNSVYGVLLASIFVVGVLLFFLFDSYVHAGTFYAGLIPLIDTISIVVLVTLLSLWTLHPAPGIVGTVLLLIEIVFVILGGGELNEVLFSLVFMLILVLCLAVFRREQAVYIAGDRTVDITGENPTNNEKKRPPFGAVWLISLLIVAVIVGSVVAGTAYSLSKQEEKDSFTIGEQFEKEYQNVYANVKFYRPETWFFYDEEHLENNNASCYGPFYNPVKNVILFIAESKSFAVIDGEVVATLEATTLDLDVFRNQFFKEFEQEVGEGGGQFTATEAACSVNSFDGSAMNLVTIKKYLVTDGNGKSMTHCFLFFEVAGSHVVTFRITLEDGTHLDDVLQGLYVG